MPSHLSLIRPTYSEKINHLRAVAAFWIFVFHYYHFIAHSFFAPLSSVNPFELLIYHGYLFVYLFFILSGYLLSRAYTNSLDLKSYLTKRVGRIFPAFYLCIVVYILFFSGGNWDYNLLFAVFSFDLQVYPNPIGHLWFINRLLECYLLFPLLWWVLKKTGKTGLVLIYLLCLTGGACWVLLTQAALVLYYGSLILCLSSFILGMLMTLLKSHAREYLFAGFALLFFVLILNGFHQSNWQTPLAYNPLSVLWFNFIAVLFALLIKCYLSMPVYLPRLLSLLLKKLGQYSYSFYLYHFLVIHFFIQHREYLSAYNSLNFVGLFLLSVISAVFFQRLLVMLSHGVLYFKRGIYHKST